MKITEVVIETYLQSFVQLLSVIPPRFDVLCFQTEETLLKDFFEFFKRVGNKC